MLFNSYIFIFLFLPITLLLFFSFARYSHRAGLVVLFLASLIFYNWYDYRYTILLLFSISVNFITSKSILKSSQANRKYYFWFGIIFNLGLLGYFKYVNFFIDNVNVAFNTTLSIKNIALPIGISFFTFTQIAFLADIYRGFVHKYTFLNYALFVTYFPHLIAGPIIHHKEVMPQFNKNKTFKLNYHYFVLGLVFFSIGLFKKTVLADSLGLLVGPVFDTTTSYLAAADAWTAALAYSLELYFDFSGYSDMAIGLSLFIGVKLPVNFYSPYKAANIILFWRRWNMTLSRFLRDYLYIPLGGNRNGSFRRYVNLMLTMLLGGLWHGASWTFVLWGGLHGIYLCINHVWIILKNYLNIPKGGFFFHSLSGFITFFAVFTAWVFFRATDLLKAKQILHAMFFEKMVLPFKLLFLNKATTFSPDPTQVTSYGSIFLIFISLTIVWLFPNTYQLLRKYKPALLVYDEPMTKVGLQWKPTFLWNIFIVLILVLGIIHIQASSMFLYFRF
jgi:alginate O-acetyltransferase complex protein AlgI